MNRAQLPSSRGYPLLSLFILLAVAAVLFSMLHSSLRQITFGDRPAAAVVPAEAPEELRSVDPVEFAWIVVAGVLLGALVGCLIGGILGHHRPRRVEGYLAGLGTGVLLGAAISILAYCPPDFRVVLAGCTLLLAVGGVIHLTRK